MLEVLKCNNVTKSLGNKKIINGVDLVLKNSEIIGMIGPNGAGKTSLMKLLTGLYKLDKGEISIDGIKQESDFPSYIKNIGAIIENPKFYPNLTGKQCLNYYAEIRNIGKERILEVTELVGLNLILNQKVKTYSLGNKQRLGIAQALLSNPNVLILDEPFNGLDPDGISELRQIILKQKEQGKTILISSHTLPELEQICDRFIFLKSGLIVKEIKNSELKATSYSTIHVNSKDIELTKKILDEKYGYQFKYYDSKIIVENITQDELLDIVIILRGEGVSISNIINESETLQDYYDEVISGGK